MGIHVRFFPQQGDGRVRYYDMENFLMVRMDQVQRYRMAKDLRKRRMHGHLLSQLSAA